MAVVNINQVVVTGNLTRDPELRSMPSGTKVASMRIAINDMPNKDTKEQHTNYIDVTAFGPQAERHCEFLSKGRPIAVAGRLRTRDYTDKENNKRTAFEIVADNVQYLNQGQGNGNGNGGQQQQAPADDQAPAEGSGQQPALTGDDIPF